MTDATNLIRIVQEAQPDEIYNLAAQSHVAVSFETPEYTANADAIGPLRMLEAIRILGLVEKTKFYQASTPSSTDSFRKRPSAKRRPSTPARPMRQPSFTPTGLPSIIGKLTAFSDATAFCLITSRRPGAKPS